MMVDRAAIRRVIAANINWLGDGQYLIRSAGGSAPGIVDQFCLGLEVLANLRYDQDDYLTVEIIDEVRRARLTGTVDEAGCYRLALVHPDLFRLLISLLIG
jgi:hypothetical protein